MRTKKRSSGNMLVFAAVQLLLIFFYIRHQSSLIKLSSQRQRYEQQKLKLSEKKQDLKHQLHESHNPSRIKEFADQVQMQKITLDQIKMVPHEQNTAT